MATLGTVSLGGEEKTLWKQALEDYMFENPNDWIARWLYGGMDSGMWEESMYADILRDWYGGLPEAFDRKERRTPTDPWGRRLKGMMPEPAWMGDLIAERGEDIKHITGWEEGLGRWGTPIYDTAPGQATALRPMGAQMNLTTEQLDELMYYLAYTKGGKPASGKEYLQTVAYKMPGWIQDYISMSQAAWPTVTPPKAVTRPAWQR